MRESAFHFSTINFTRQYHGRFNFVSLLFIFYFLFLILLWTLQKYRKDLYAGYDSSFFFFLEYINDGYLFNYMIAIDAKNIEIYKCIFCIRSVRQI